MGQTENNEQNGRFKLRNISNHIKCKWSKHFNRKAEIIKLDKSNPTVWHLQKRTKNQLEI